MPVTLIGDVSSPVENPMFESGVLLARRYRLEQPLASGGMAEVWAGHDTILRRDVALKLLHPHLANDATVVERFRREAVAAAGLAHPHIVPTFDTGEDETGAFIVMGLVHGPTLKEVISSDAPMPVNRIASITKQVAEAIAHAHSRGIVHRDVKPANILLIDGNRVMVTDFGIAKGIADVAESALTMPGLVVATPGYSAPEQLRGEATDARVDIYALGVLIHEMACSHVVAGSETTMLAEASDTKTPELCSSLPSELVSVVAKATAPDPDDRYQSASDLAIEMALLERTSIPQPGPPVTTEGPRKSIPSNPTMTMTAKRPAAVELPTTSGSKRRRTLTVVVAAALVLAAFGVGQAVRVMGDEEPRPVAAPSAPVTLQATSFDPFGSNGQEHEAEAPRAVDNNAATAWTTETYVDRNMNKRGVGLILRSPTPSEMRSLEVQSLTSGWSAEIYVASGAPRNFDQWGQPIDVQSGLGQSARFDLKGQAGDSVLLWLTDVGNSGQFAATEVRMVAS